MSRGTSASTHNRAFVAAYIGSNASCSVDATRNPPQIKELKAEVLIRCPNKKVNSWSKTQLVAWLESNPREDCGLPTLESLQNSGAGGGGGGRSETEVDDGHGVSDGGSGPPDDSEEESPPKAKKARRKVLGANDWARMMHVICEKLKIEFQQRDQPL